MGRCSCCSKCKKRVKWSKGSIPDESFFKSMKTASGKCSHVVVFGIALCLLGLFFLPEVQKVVYNDGLDWHAPDPEDLKVRTIRMTGLDFQSDELQSKLNTLAWNMEHICEERTDDVVFAFQYRDKKGKKRVDHMFMYCKTKKAYANAEIVYSNNNEQVYCKEEYAGAYREVLRSSDITMRGINVEGWENEDVETSDPQEACVIQHAVSVLNNEW